MLWHEKPPEKPLIAHSTGRKVWTVVSAVLVGAITAVVSFLLFTFLGHELIIWWVARGRPVYGYGDAIAWIEIALAPFLLPLFAGCGACLAFISY
jgi:hypothetical protein